MAAARRRLRRAWPVHPWGASRGALPAVHDPARRGHVHRLDPEVVLQPGQLVAWHGLARPQQDLGALTRALAGLATSSPPAQVPAGLPRLAGCRSPCPS